MEEKLKLEHPELTDETKTHIRVKTEKEREKRKAKILETIPKEIMEKLNPEERDILIRAIELKLIEGKEPKLKDDKPDLIEHPKPRCSELLHIEGMQEIELMIQLCANKQELIKLLNDINKFLVESNKEHYNVNIKKRK